jgi:hypothetical protein
MPLVQPTRSRETSFSRLQPPFVRPDGVLGVTGAAAFGLVWGWLLAPRVGTPEWRRWTWLGVASALAGVELLLLSGLAGLAGGAAAATVSFGLHTGGRRQLRAGR